MGPRGLTLLVAAGVIAVGLAVHGYGGGAVVGAAGVGMPAPAGSSPASSTSPGPKPTTPASTATSSPAGAGAKLGPLLSSTQYGHYAYQVYPGPESSQARLATAGFTIDVTPHSGTIHVSVSTTGSNQGPPAKSYPAGDRVYFIEALFGDDSGNADYNFGDDGVVVTDAHGHLVQ